jgi:hypothetical protein
MPSPRFATTSASKLYILCEQHAHTASFHTASFTRRRASEYNIDCINHRPTIEEYEARKAFCNENDNGPMAGIRQAVMKRVHMPEWSMVSGHCNMVNLL